MPGYTLSFDLAKMLPNNTPIRETPVKQKPPHPMQCLPLLWPMPEHPLILWASSCSELLPSPSHAASGAVGKKPAWHVSYRICMLRPASSNTAAKPQDRQDARSEGMAWHFVELQK